MLGRFSHCQQALLLVVGLFALPDQKPDFLQFQRADNGLERVGYFKIELFALELQGVVDPEPLEPNQAQQPDRHQAHNALDALVGHGLFGQDATVWFNGASLQEGW